MRPKLRAEGKGRGRAFEAPGPRSSVGPPTRGERRPETPGGARHMPSVELRRSQLRGFRCGA